MLHKEDKTEMKKKRALRILSLILLCALTFTACKKNVGTPEDNAASKDENTNINTLKSRLASIDKEISGLIKALAKGIAEDEIVQEIQIRQAEKKEINQKLSELEKTKTIPNIDIDEYKKFLIQTKEFILKTNVDSPELKEVMKKFVKSITISKEEVVIIYNFLLFWRINIPNLYIIVTINRNIFYNRKRKKKKFT